MTANYPLLKLKRGEDRRILAGHLWIYSNEIDTQDTSLKSFSAGELVVVASSNGRAIAIAYINPRTLICARILTRDLDESVDGHFITSRLETALCLREKLFDQPFYRWVYADADLMPGLMIDRYGDFISVQITTAGMERLKPEISDAIMHVVPSAKIIWRNDAPIRELEGLESYVEMPQAELPSSVSVYEGDLIAQMSLDQGQKTGWFYDQRKNRQIAARFAKDQDVLDVFCYVGGWGLQSAMAGAKSVTCIDSSAPALDMLTLSAEKLGLSHVVSAVNSDAFDYLKNARTESRKYGLVIVDPPALIKRKKDIKAGMAAYRRLIEMAMHLVKKDGILVFCSCSRLLEWNDMRKLSVQASRRSERVMQIVRRLHQDSDHPVHPAIPETDYLNGFVARVY